MHLFRKAIWGLIWKLWRKTKQMQPMWLCILLFKRFKDTLKNAQWRKVKEMQPMRLCIFSGKSLEDTFVNAQWRKVKQMQPMWLCLFSGKQFKDTFENAQWRKVNMQQMWLCLLWEFDNTHIIINWWSVNWWPVRFFTHDPTWDWTTVSLQSNQIINLGNVLSLTARLCKISGDGSGWYFRTFRTLFHSTKVETNHLIIRAGNPDD